MHSAILLASFLLVAADAPGAKTPTPDAASKEQQQQVASLVKQLDARELTARDEAEKKLLEMGPAVLPLLPRISDETPAEVALRVSRVQQKLLQAQADAAAAPTLVTLKADDAPISEIFAEISKQTGNSIVDHREAFGEDKTDPHVSVKFDKTPFWKALDEVLDKGELMLYPFAGERGAYVVNRAPGAKPRSEGAVYSGIFRLEPVRFEAVRDLRNENMQSLRLYVEATWEPRLQPFAILQPLGQLSAVGDSGEAIAIAGDDAMPEATIRAGMSSVELEIPLALPSRSIGKIRALKGKFQAMVPGPAEDFRFASPPITERNSPTKRIEQRKAGATVTLDRLRKNNAAWEVSLRVKFDNPSTALESHRGWMLDNEIYFTDSTNRRVEPGGFEQSRQARDEIGINYYFDLAEDPGKLELVYRTPITILDMNVNYELHDLPLP